METHFAYRVEGSENRDIATYTYNLSVATVDQRRALINRLVAVQLYLAKLPCAFDATKKVDLGKLTAFLNGEFV